MPTYTGTTSNDSWNLITPGTFTLDGLAGVDTLNLGTSLRSSYSITQAGDGAVHIDSISGASAALHATLYNMEILTFNSRKDVLDLSTYFGTKVPPTVSITDNTTGTATGNVTYLLSFSEAVTGLATNDITVSNGSVSSISGSGSNYSVVVAPAANTEGTMSLTLNAASVTDASGSPNALATAAAQPIDTRAPTISSFNPANQNTNVAVGSDIVFTFSEPIAKGTGNITLITAAGAIVAAYDAASSTNLNITGSALIINPTADLAYDTGYKVVIAAGTIRDLAGNSYAGTTSYSFTTAAFVNSTPTGSVTITGTPTQGQTLALANTLADLDGLGTFSYLWKTDGVVIPGATLNSLTLSEAQVGKAITAAVSYTDGHGTAESVVSAASSVVANINDAPTGNVTITGNPNLGQVLTASNTIADPDGLGAISYQWSAGGVAISGATSSTLTLTAAQVGKTVSVAASYTDGHGTAETLSSPETATVTEVDPTGPVVSTFTPLDEAGAVPVGANISFTFNEPIQWGIGSITLKDAAGATVASYNAGAGPNLSLSGNTLTVNPTKDLGIFTGYKVEIGAGAVKDMAGNGNLAVSDYNFTTETIDRLYHFFVVAFNAAPGVEYMNQLAVAWNWGMSLKEIVSAFTTKGEFIKTYPESLSIEEFTTRMVNNVVKSSATQAVKQEAHDGIVWCLEHDWTRADVIYQVFGNLANMPLDEPKWGGTAHQFLNQTAVARYFTEVMHNDTTDVATLRAVVADVTQDTDVSTPELIATLIGVELGGGP